MLSLHLWFFRLGSAMRLLREKQVLQIIPISRASLWCWVRAGKFPAPSKLYHCTVWAEEDVLAFVREIINTGDS
jgi:predicted DNA-binding transcriptional regulator AlpA